MTAGLDPLRLTAREARRLLTDGEVAASELTKTYLDQIGPSKTGCTPSSW